MINTLVSQLTAARDSLNADNWHKGSLFWANKQICMCAHGAVQFETNPLIKNKNFNYRPYNLCRDPAQIESVSNKGYVDTHKDNANMLEIWLNRPNDIKNDFTRDDFRGNLNYGNLDAHYLLGMVGLTTGFNDHKDTTLEMVKAKFDEAIELAKMLELN